MSEITFITQADPDFGALIGAHETSLQGTIQASALRLSQAFGSPDVNNNVHEKITTDWVIAFSDGVIVHIYDWGQPTVPELEEVITWRIGGKTRADVERVHELFRVANNLNAGVSA